jgi:glycosyltransferase involved in cell wall biosynthesis
MRSSDHVVAVTPAQRDSIRNRYPDQPEGKFLFVPNGFDEELFEGFRPQRGDRQGMVVGYFGSLYASPPYHPGAYLQAVESLPEAIREQIETRFIGRIAREAEPVLAASGARLTRMGFLPRAEGVKQLEQCDYLLLIANERTTHAGKLFDYLAAGLPILALTTPEGEIARIIQETRAGLAVDGSSPEAIRALLLAAWERLQGRSSPFREPDREAVMAYERRHLVDRLVKLTRLGGGEPMRSGSPCDGSTAGRQG